MTTTEAPIRAAELLRKTRDLFEATHWTQRTFYTNDEDAAKAKFCAVGGIRYYVIGDPLAGMLDTLVVEATADEVREKLGQGEGSAEWGEDGIPLEYELAVRALAAAYFGVDDVLLVAREEGLEGVEDKVYDWNDDEDRTLGEVLEAFQTAQGLVGEVMFA